MQYGGALIALGVAQIVLARAGGPTGWLLVWSGASWIVAGCGCAFFGAKVFGKRSDGQLTLWNAALLLPFLVVTWLLWHLQTALSREPHRVEIAPGLWRAGAATVHTLLSEGHTNFALDVATDNRQALSLYQYCGFHEVTAYDDYTVPL